jgi:peptidoglycan L-alanyl-D-glutamate endopeptidase CwlK
MDYESIDEYRSNIKERLASIETILNRELPDIKEQLKLANGRTRSLENWRKYSKHMEGKAVDLAPYPIDWEDRERFHYMGGMIRGIGHQLGLKIRWGGDWDSDGEIKDNRFDDLVHVEIRE